MATSASVPAASAAPPAGALRTAAAVPVLAHRAIGGWLAAASAMLAVTLALHGPLAPEPTVQMQRIADHALRWRLVHWIAAAGLASYAVTALVTLASGSRLAATGGRAAAWAVLGVAALATATTAVAEATVITDAAVLGATERFVAWWAFAEGHAAAITAFAVAAAAIAWAEARDPHAAVPAWSAHVAVAAGALSAAGWALGVWLAVPVGNLVWVVSSLVLAVWLLWLGVRLARAPAVAR